jgi:hypothetical protein
MRAVTSRVHRLALAALLVALTSCAGDPTVVGPPAANAPAASPAAASTPDLERGAVATRPRLRDELLSMLAADQRDRQGDGQGGVGRDQERTARLAAIVDEHGWPTRTLVGDDGATAAWAIAQHSDLDPAFQREALGLMQSAVELGEADAGELAYLTDRVAANAGQPQTYGTQMGCTPDGAAQPARLAEPERVDQLRAEAGLPPLQDYLAEMAETCAGS